MTIDKKDLQKFSFAKLIETCVRGERLTGVEREITQLGQLEGRANNLTSGPYTVPGEVLRETRDLTATGGSGGSEGGLAVQTDNLPIIDALRARMVVANLGATVMLGRIGNVAIPIGVGETALVAKAENDAATEDATTMTARAMTPTRIPVHIDISRQLLYQTDGEVERWVRRNITARLAIALEKYAISGSGTGEPTGILNTAGINAVAGGANGLAPTLDHIVDLEHQVALDDGEVGPAGYLTNPKVRSKLKRTRIDATAGINVWGAGQELNGYPVGVSTAVPSDLTKGTSSEVCSAIIYSGSWSDLWIVTWGGIEFFANPYSDDTLGNIRVTMALFADVAIARPAVFSAMQDALTA